MLVNEQGSTFNSASIGLYYRELNGTLQFFFVLNCNLTGVIFPLPILKLRTKRSYEVLSTAFFTSSSNMLLLSTTVPSGFVGINEETAGLIYSLFSLLVDFHRGLLVSFCPEKSRPSRRIAFLFHTKSTYIAWDVNDYMRHIAYWYLLVHQLAR